MHGALLCHVTWKGVTNARATFLFVLQWHLITLITRKNLSATMSNFRTVSYVFISPERPYRPPSAPLIVSVSWSPYKSSKTDAHSSAWTRANTLNNPRTGKPANVTAFIKHCNDLPKGHPPMTPTGSNDHDAFEMMSRPPPKLASQNAHPQRAPQMDVAFCELHPPELGS